MFFFFSSRRRHTRLVSDWSSDVCSSDLNTEIEHIAERGREGRQAEDRRAGGGARHRQCPWPIDEQREIGRASCRERVEISVEAGAERKKKYGGGVSSIQAYAQNTGEVIR